MLSLYKLKHQAQDLREEVCSRAGMSRGSMIMAYKEHQERRRRTGERMPLTRMERLAFEVSWLISLRDNLDKL